MIPIPNRPESAVALARYTGAGGLLLTGGGDILAMGGDMPERDATERALIAWARENRLPVLGVCRGMQLIQDLFGVPFTALEGHVATRHRIGGNGGAREVNSYHGFGATTTPPVLEVFARAEDGVIEEVGHVREAIRGIMWHPERESPFHASDLRLFKAFFNGGEDGGCGA